MATLETGRLQVKVNKQPEKYFLEPNDQLIYTPSTGIVQQHKVNAVSHSDWRMGGLFFGNVPFNDVLHTLERVYGVKFHVRTSIYQNQSLRVHFNRNESLEQVLQIIKILVPGKMCIRDRDYEVRAVTMKEQRTTGGELKKMQYHT